MATHIPALCKACKGPLTARGICTRCQRSDSKRNGPPNKRPPPKGS